jgi:Tc toxin complex TcA C-terminal TcB-binding domain/Concanavalin A-like lectin/glucanases superfamily
MKEEQGFHNYYDANYGMLSHELISRELSYRFYSHFHPYVAELVNRLVKKSIPGLQAADTEYSSSNNKGTLEVLPDSTLVALTADMEVTLSDGNKLKVSKGTQIFLPDGTGVTIEQDGVNLPPDFGPILVPGTMTTTRPLSMVFYSIYDSKREVRIEANKGKLILSASQEVRLPEGRHISLPAETTKFLFLGCKPKAKLYERIFPNLLVAYWKFDDDIVGTPGVSVHDSSGNNHHGKYDVLTRVEGKIDHGFGFTRGSSILIKNSPLLEKLGKDGGDFSVAFWIRVTKGPTGKRRSIMLKGTGDENGDKQQTCALWLQENDNRIRYAISTEVDWDERMDSVKQIELNVWTHICYIKVGNRLRLYINGILDSERVLSSNSKSNPGDLNIGYNRWDPGFTGSLDDVQIYSRALSEKEIGEVASGLRYVPTDLVERPYPVKELDFSSSGPYSVYNWELFYHVPLTLAIHLSKNQRFEEAQRWFHYIFDPTTSGDDDNNNSDLPAPERFWKVKPFQYTDVKSIEEILVNLSSGADPKLQQDTIDSSQALANTPFRPHVVARYRQTAYMFKTVMSYLDNLIAWGDSLFRQDTAESINEATQLYVLAANILGPRPQAVPKNGSVRPKTYASLRTDLEKSKNIIRDLETDIAFDLAPHPNNNNNEDTDTHKRSSIILPSLVGAALYFCVPRNDKLLSYWDTVADRLFKIHNSLNIQGIFRQLPLFEPPIDPGLLAKAAAAGLDVGAIVSGINQPLPLVRFQFLVQKAAEICQEVKSLGNNLLSAIEKEDNEALAVLRAKHERVILGLAETVKYGQLQEAIKAREGLEKSFNNAVQRYTYYEQLLGRQENEIRVSAIDALDKSGLEKMNYKASEPEVPERDIAVDIAKGVGDLSSGKIISSHEKEELEKMASSQNYQDAAIGLETTASIWRLVPQFGLEIMPFGVGGDTKFGGVDIAEIFRILATISRGISGRLSYQASRAAKIGSYARREQEWAFQSNVAAGEITQTFKQLRAAQIREAIAEREWKNHQQQMHFAEEIERFLTDEKTGKKTNQAFYSWMKREVKGLYAQCFQFAFDVAKKAERALQHELGNQELSFIQFSYLAGKEGLLAGEKLYLDIKRMEMAYHDELNQREYELIKHVSLLQVNPQALLTLRATGRCTAFLPEELFDIDCPGHYFRRIKSVAVSIPSVTGPYTSVNCTLTLLKSSIRKNALLRDGVYAREGPEDNRFSDHFGSMQSIVTSTAQNDSGLFETSLRDERYLPFEASGVISEWQLELPDEMRQFNYDTISDVILHLRYTAREGGGMLRRRAVANLKTKIEEAQAAGSIRLFSIRHEFPSEWAKFKSINTKDNNTKAAPLVLELRQEHFPFWSQGRIDVVRRVDLLVKQGTNTIKVTSNGVENSFAPNSSWVGLRTAEVKPLPQEDPNVPLLPIKFNLSFDDNSMEDLWLALTWSSKSG